jgi:hypothetical protein
MKDTLTFNKGLRNKKKTNLPLLYVLQNNTKNRF